VPSVSITQIAPTEASFTYAIRLSFWERIKALFTGTIQARISVAAKLPPVLNAEGVDAGGTPVDVRWDFVAGNLSVTPSNTRGKLLL
jgi:hypothetical protein